MKSIPLPVILIGVLIAVISYLIYRERKFGQVVSENGNLLKLQLPKKQKNAIS